MNHAACEKMMRAILPDAMRKTDLAVDQLTPSAVVKPCVWQYDKDCNSAGVMGIAADADWKQVARLVERKLRQEGTKGYAVAQHMMLAPNDELDEDGDPEWDAIPMFEATKPGMEVISLVAGTQHNTLMAIREVTRTSHTLSVGEWRKVSGDRYYGELVAGASRGVCSSG